MGPERHRGGQPRAQGEGLGQMRHGRHGGGHGHDDREQDAALHPAAQRLAAHCRHGERTLARALPAARTVAALPRQLRRLHSEHLLWHGGMVRAYLQPRIWGEQGRGRCRGHARHARRRHAQAGDARAHPAHHGREAAAGKHRAGHEGAHRLAARLHRRQRKGVSRTRQATSFSSTPPAADTPCSRRGARSRPEGT